MEHDLSVSARKGCCITRYAAHSTTQDAQAAGVGKGTLYRRYAHKGELCVALLKDTIGEVEYLADALLAQLDVDLYIFQRDVRGYSSERIRSGLSYLLESIEIASATKRRTEKNEL